MHAGPRPSPSQPLPRQQPRRTSRPITSRHEIFATPAISSRCRYPPIRCLPCPSIWASSPWVTNRHDAGRMTRGVHPGYGSIPAPGRHDRLALEKALLRAGSNDCSEQGVLWQDDATRTGGGKTFKAVGLTATAGLKVIPAVERKGTRKEKEKGGERGKEVVILGWQEGKRASSIYQHPRYHYRREKHLSCPLQHNQSRHRKIHPQQQINTSDTRYEGETMYSGYK